MISYQATAFMEESMVLYLIPRRRIRITQGVKRSIVMGTLSFRAVKSIPLLNYTLGVWAATYSHCWG